VTVEEGVAPGLGTDTARSRLVTFQPPTGGVGVPGGTPGVGVPVPAPVPLLPPLPPPPEVLGVPVIVASRRL